MRRLILAIVLVALPGLTITPALVHAGQSAPSTYRTPAPEHSGHSAAGKHKKKPAKCKKSAKGKKSKGCKKHGKPVKKPTPKPTRKPTATRVPTRTPDPTSTPTLVPTPTLTPTVTLTATPTSSTAQIRLRSDVSAGYQAGFYVCGLPAGVSATFTPNPATSVYDTSSPSRSSAQTLLGLSVPWTVSANQYGLEVYAYYQDKNGHPVNTAPNAVIEPRALILTVNTDGTSSLKATDAVPASGGQGCSGLPAGFGPVPTPTVAPGDVKVSATVTPAHPAANQHVTVEGKITLRGQPIPLVPVTVNFFGPFGIPGCNTTTANDGTAICTIVNAHPIAGYTVLVQVVFAYNGQQYTAYTSYTM